MGLRPRRTWKASIRARSSMSASRASLRRNYRLPTPNDACETASTTAPLEDIFKLNLESEAAYLTFCTFSLTKSIVRIGLLLLCILRYHSHGSFHFCEIKQ